MPCVLIPGLALGVLRYVAAPIGRLPRPAAPAPDPA